jgi:hypothetical protein
MWFLFALNGVWATLLVSGCWFFRAYGGQALAYSYLAADGVRLTIVLVDLRRRQRRIVRPGDSLAAVPC